jgi:type IX secretion system PorP/SprF family membrane protein
MAAKLRFTLLNRYISIAGGFFILLVMSENALCQEQFQFNQFIHSASAINPAFNGVEDAVNLNIGFRKQWAAIDEAPTNYYASFSGSLSGMKSAFTDNRSLRTSVPRLYRKQQNEKGTINHGIGMYVLGDVFGPFHRNSLYLGYAMIFTLSKEFKLSGGIQTEFTNHRFRAEKVQVYNPDQDAVYQQYASGPGNESWMNINAGVMIYGKGLFFGYSAHQLANVMISSENLGGIGASGIYHFLLAGYNVPLSSQVIFQPSTLVKYNSTYPVTFDVLAKLKYREVFWGGLSYRYMDAFGFQLGFQMSKKIHVNYSYEAPTSDIGTYAKGSHELVLGFRIYNDKVSTPFLW